MTHFRKAVYIILFMMTIIKLPQLGSYLLSQNILSVIILISSVYIIQWRNIYTCVIVNYVNTHVTINSNILVLFLGSLSPSGKYYHIFAPGLLSAIIALGRRARAKWRHCTKKMADSSDIAERTLYSLAK